jgi:hypothetical protein
MTLSHYGVWGHAPLGVLKFSDLSSTFITNTIIVGTSIFGGGGVATDYRILNVIQCIANGCSYFRLQTVILVVYWVALLTYPIASVLLQISSFDQRDHC